jgi:hypothetical protein
MVTSWPNSEGSCRSRLSGFNEINGRHEETRTPDLYRVKVRFTTTYNNFHVSGKLRSTSTYVEDRRIAGWNQGLENWEQGEIPLLYFKSGCSPAESDQSAWPA